MSRVLVTGGLGFIGSNLSIELARQGHDLTIVDDLSSSREDYKSIIDSLDANFIIGCFASEDILARINSKEFDFIFHLAAIPRVGFSVEQPFLTTDVNVSKTVKLLEASIGNIERFIFSSSSSVYGGADILPTPTDHPKDPKSPYAWQKSSIEDLIKIFCNLHDFDALCLRYFNVFGPGQFGGSAYSTAISAWCHAVKNGTSLRKDGTGEQSRDMCYIDNVVSANILSMNSQKKFRGQRYNVACGDRTSNNEILDYFQGRFGDLDIINAPFRKGDVMHTQADINSTISDLNYEPLVRFWEGIQKTVEWWEI